MVRSLQAWLILLFSTAIATSCNQFSDSASTISATEPPVILYTSNPVALPANGQAITPIVPTSTSSGMTYSISPSLPTGLSFDSKTGTISGTAPTTAWSSYENFEVKGSNSFGSDYVALSIWFYGTLQPSYSGPFTGYQNFAFSTVTPTLSGAPSSTFTSCSITPALPAGLTFNTSTCSISGTPTATSALTTYTVTVVNTVGNGTGTFTLQVLSPPVPNISYPQSSYTWTKNTAITPQSVSNAGGLFVNCSVSPALPAGLSLETSDQNCTISGTPTAVTGATSYTVSTVGGSGADSTSISITVNNVLPVILYPSSSYTFLDQHAISTVVPSTLTSVSSCSIAPALPAGLSFNTGTCQITGTPTTTSSAAFYTVTAQNSTGQTTTTGFTITVNESAPNPSYPGSPFTFSYETNITPVNPTTTGGGPITSCVITPALPAGIAYTQSCQIIGTPTVYASAVNYTVTASNSAGSTNVTISVQVLAAVPAFSYPQSPYTFTKGTVISTIVPTVTSGVITSCSVSPALPAGLSLNTSNCAISGTPTAVAAAANYTVTGTDSTGSSNATINITVNDIAPVISYPLGPYNFTQNTSIGTVNPTNTGGAITGCSVTPALPTGLSLNTTTCAMTGTPTAVTASASYVVTATNSGGTSSASVVIQVSNSAPGISYAGTPYTFTNGSGGGLPVSVTNSGGSISSCTITPALPAGLSFSLSTCQISGTPTVISAGTQYTVTATNTGGSSTTTVTIKIVDTVPIISYAGSPFALGANNAMTAANVTNTGGVIASCSSSPTLPAGLTISSACQISGTPTTQQAATNYTISATNTAGTATTNISIAVVIVPSITYPGSPYTFTKGSAITTVVPNNTGSAATTCTSGTWGPTGLTLNSDCSISGTPTALQVQASYTIANSNSNGSGANATVKITVNDVAPTITYSPSTFIFNKNVAITSVTPTLGGGAVTGCVSSPALPAGLSINNTTCVISGTPTAYSANQAYTITASNTGGSATSTLLITVDDSVPVLAFSGSPYAWNINTSVGTVTPTNTGGAVTSCSSSPTLPAGLNLSTACVITGTPTGSQSATNYTISSTNSGGTSTVNISIAVITVPVITYTGSPYSFTKGSLITPITPNNSGSPATTCTSGTWGPTGLTLNADCSITGTPTALQAQTSYTVANSNADGSGANATVKITIVDVPPTLTYNPTSYTFNRNVAITSVTPTLGGGAVTGCTVSPSLPTGLSLNNTTCVISGTPSVYAAAQTYAITASNTGGSASQNLTIGVSDSIPAISYAGTPFIFTINTSIGAAGATTLGGGAVTSCSISPTLPAGLNLDTACNITGTPTAGQNATTYTVLATNSGGTQNVSISIAVNTIPNISYSPSSYTYTNGVAITALNPNNAGFGPITSCTISPNLNAQTGLTFSTTTCQISGTPSAIHAATSYTVTPTSAVGAGSAATVTITVNDAAPTISYSPTVYSFSRNVAITSVTPTLGGGTVTGCTASPTLPTGLSVNNTTCVISGTPSVYTASQSYTITASNTGGSASQTLTIGVNDSLPAISYAGSPFTFTINSSAGTNTPTNTGGAVTSCTTSPALPAGLNLSTACVITGTPTVGQNATTYTVYATNSGGTQNVNISIAVNTVPNISYSPSSYSYTKGTAITALNPTNAGFGAITSCTISPDVNAQTGLTFSTTTCQISGTPTAIHGSTSYTVTPTSAVGAGSAANVTITVNDAVPTLSYGVTSGTYVVRQAISNWNATTGGGAITGCSSSPTLPTGLSINNTTCQITGTPTVTASSATYTITASNTGGNATANLSIKVKNAAQFVFFSKTDKTAGTWNGTATSSYNIWQAPVDGNTASMINVTGNNASANLDSEYPSYFPSGGSILFASKQAVSAVTANSYNIWSMTASTGVPTSGAGASQTALTGNTNANLNSAYFTTYCPPENCVPVVSPDGAKIAFSSEAAVNGSTNGTGSSSYNIFYMNVNGTNLTALTQNTNASLDSISPVWSTDSTTIFFASIQGTNTTAGNWNKSANNNFNIWSVVASSGTLSDLTAWSHAGYNSYEPQVSSDGVTIVFTSATPPSQSGAASSSTNIWQVHTDGTHLFNLTNNTAANLNSKNPSFSPDGTEIVFASQMGVPGASSSYNIFKMASTGASQTYLTTNTAASLDSVYPSWEPDNLYIAFQSLQKIGGTTPSSNNIWVMKQDGTSQTAITQNTAAGLDSYIGATGMVWYQP